MTTRYDRARGNLDRHANYIVVDFLDGSGEKQPRPQVVDTPRWLNLCARLSWLNTTCGGTLPDIVFSRQDIMDPLGSSVSWGPALHHLVCRVAIAARSASRPVAGAFVPVAAERCVPTGSVPEPMHIAPRSIIR